MRAAGGVAEPREIRYKASTAAATALVALSSFVAALNYEPAMMKSTETRVAAALCVLLCCVARAASAPAPLCAGAAEDDPRAARFCQALNTFLELYAEAAGEQVPEYQALVRDYPQLLDTGMKRQDVVHSFLRFGRRR